MRRVDTSVSSSERNCVQCVLVAFRAGCVHDESSFQTSSELVEFSLVQLVSLFC